VWKVHLSNGTTIQLPLGYDHWKSDQPSFEYNGESPQSCAALCSKWTWDYQWNDELCDIDICSVCEVDL